MEIVQPQTTEKERKGMRNVNWRGVFTKRRKVMILAGMFVLLVVTGYLNFTMNNRSNDVGGAITNQNMFQVFRTTRPDERASRLAVYENIIMSTTGFSEQARRTAEENKFNLQAAISFENTAEGLIKLKGFQDALVSKNNGNINVLVRHNQQLTDLQVFNIQNSLDTLMDAPINIDHLFISVIA